MSNKRWSLAAACFSIAVAGPLIAQGQGGGGGGGGEETAFGNNLAVPVIFAEGYGVTGFPTAVDTGLRPTLTETNPTLPYWDSSAIYVLDGVTYYPQQTASTWRADWRNGAAEGEHVTVNWSDNLLNTKWSSNSVIRVETVMYQNAVDPTDTMNAYTMGYLQGEGTTELWGADTTTYATPYRTVFSPNARLKIEKITGPGGTVVDGAQSFDGLTADKFGTDGPGGYGAEINVSGNLVYGYNWMLQQWAGTEEEKAGWYRLTFSIDPTVTYTITAEDGTSTTYTVDPRVLFDGVDATDSASSALFRAKLTDASTSVLEIEVLASNTGGSPTMPLVVTLTGTGTGTVSSNPAGITCGTDCSENYARNTVVTLTATPDQRSDFMGWGGDADCADGSVTMEGGRYCEANFTRFPTVTTDKTTLTFTTVVDGTSVVVKSPSQAVHLLKSGGSTKQIPYEATTDVSWIMVSPGSGTGTTLNVDVSPPTLPAGTSVSGTVTLALTGAEQNTVSFTVVLESIAKPESFSTDDQSDLVWRHQVDGRVAIWFMRGTSLLLASVTNPPVVADLNWQLRASGDFSGDGKPDFIWQNTANGRLAAWFMDDLNLIATPPLTTLADNGTEPDLDWKIVGGADMDRDGQRDLVWQHGSTGDLRIWHMNGTTQLDSTPLPFSVGTSDWDVAALGDMNGDGYTDFVWRNATTGGLAVWHMTDAERMSTMYMMPGAVVDPAWVIVGARDLNADGKTDLVWQHMATGRLAAWLMDGVTMTSGFHLTPDYVHDPGWRIVAVR